MVTDATDLLMNSSVSSAIISRLGGIPLDKNIKGRDVTFVLRNKNGETPGIEIVEFK